MKLTGLEDIVGQLNGIALEHKLAINGLILQKKFFHGLSYKPG